MRLLLFAVLTLCAPASRAVPPVPRETRSACRAWDGVGCYIAPSSADAPLVLFIRGDWVVAKQTKRPLPAERVAAAREAYERLALGATLPVGWGLLVYGDYDGDVWEALSADSGRRLKRPRRVVIAAHSRGRDGLVRTVASFQLDAGQAKAAVSLERLVLLDTGRSQRLHALLEALAQTSPATACTGFHSQLPPVAGCRLDPIGKEPGNSFHYLPVRECFGRYLTGAPCELTLSGRDPYDP